MIGFSQTFIDHSNRLNNEVNVRSARDTGELMRKMDTLLTYAFTPTQEWEKKLRAKVLQYGPVDKWIDKVEIVKEMIETSDDNTIDTKSLFSSLNNNSNAKRNQADDQKLKTFMEELREELKVPLKDLFDSNMGIFTQRLEFHARQLDLAITKSASSIVKQLSGPYHRLEHEVCRSIPFDIQKTEYVLYLRV